MGCPTCGDPFDTGPDLCARCLSLAQPEPTVEDYCEAGGHAYAGDDGDAGRCYCGRRLYPLGGPNSEAPR